MSNDLARARARVAAGEWLARYTGIQDPKTMTFSVGELLGAFEEGYLTRIGGDVLSGDELTLTATVLDAASAGTGPFTESDLARAARAMFAARDRLASIEDEHAIVVAIGQRQIDDATALMTEAATLFRGYEAHHQAKAERFRGWPNVPDDVAAFKVLQDKIKTNALMAARLEAWLRGEDQYPVSVGERPDDAHRGFADGGFVAVPGGRADEIPVILAHGCDLNPADIARHIGEKMVDGVTIKGVDHESFDRGRDYLDQPVEISAIDAPPLTDSELTMLKERRDATLTPVERERNEACAVHDFTPWYGGDGPPDDLDRDDAVLLDWGADQNYPWPRFDLCPVSHLHPMPGLWAERSSWEGATIIGYRSRLVGKITAKINPDLAPRERRKGVLVDTDVFPTPAAAKASGKLPRDLIAAEPDPLVALLQARKWLASAEDLIMLAADHIRGVTGANPGSDSEEICQRLDAWLAPVATPDAPTEEKS